MAAQLGLSVTALEGRLRRGRHELRRRLVRTGVGLGAALTAAHVASSTASAGSVSLQPLIAATAKAAVAHAASQAVTTLVSQEAASLAGKELAMIAASKVATTVGLSSAAVALVLVGIGAAGVGGATRSAGAAAVDTASLAFADGSSGETPDLLAQVVETVAPTEEQPSADQKRIAELQEIVAKWTDDFRQLQSDHEKLRAELDRLKAANQRLVEGRDYKQFTDQIEGLKAQLERVQSFQAADQKPRDNRTALIEASLDTPTEMEFPANPLMDIVDYFSQIHRIPILLDEAALSEAGVTKEQEVSLGISGISLRSALDILLDNVGGTKLDFVIENQVLSITTREKADQTLDTRVYSLRVLENSGFDSYSVANVIRKTIEPASWAHIEIVPEKGAGEMEGMMGMGMAPGTGGMSMAGMGSGMGPAGLGAMQINRTQSSGLGTIEALPGCLVITQCQRVHRAVADLLAQLKAQAAEADAAGPGGAAGAFDSGFGGPQPSGGNPFNSSPGGVGSSPGAGAGGPGAAAVAPGPAAASDPSTGRQVRGTIRVQGEVRPRPPLVLVGGNAPDTKHLTDPIPDESVIIGSDRGLANCIVFLDKLPAGLSPPPVPDEPAVFQVQGLQIRPHTMVVRTGQAVQVANLDPVAVNVHDAPFTNPATNQLLKPDEGYQHSYERAERLPVQIKDDIHSWMSAYVFPLNHPWAAVTDEHGRFELPALPPGEYTFKVWHEKAGYIDRQLNVTVTADAVQELQLTVDSSKFDNP